MFSFLSFEPFNEETFKINAKIIRLFVLHKFFIYLLRSVVCLELSFVVLQDLRLCVQQCSCMMKTGCSRA
nr:MAG TPA: hypothetical protein [Caudoviricetes sp.]